MSGEQLAIEPRGDIFVRVNERHVAPRQTTTRNRHESQQAPVPRQQNYDGEELPAKIGPQHQNRRDKIAKRDALRHALETPGMYVQTDERGSIHEKSDGDEDQAAFESV